MPMTKDMREVDDKGSAEEDIPIETPSKRVHLEKSKEVQIENLTPLLKPYKPPVSYPQRLVKIKEKHKYGKFLEILKKLHINIPFLEAITDMPSCANS